MRIEIAYCGETFIVTGTPVPESGGYDDDPASGGYLEGASVYWQSRDVTMLLQAVAPDALQDITERAYDEWSEAYAQECANDCEPPDPVDYGWIGAC